MEFWKIVGWWAGWMTASGVLSLITGMDIFAAILVMVVPLFVALWAWHRNNF